MTCFTRRKSCDPVDASSFLQHEYWVVSSSQVVKDPIDASSFLHFRYWVVNSSQEFKLSTQSTNGVDIHFSEETHQSGCKAINDNSGVDLQHSLLVEKRVEHLPLPLDDDGETPHPVAVAHYRPISLLRVVGGQLHLVAGILHLDAGC